MALHTIRSAIPQVPINVRDPEYAYEFNSPTRENFVQGRLDYVLNEKDSIFSRYTYDGADQSAHRDTVEARTRRSGSHHGSVLPKGSED